MTFPAASDVYEVNDKGSEIGGVIGSENGSEIIGGVGDGTGSEIGGGIGNGLGLTVRQKEILNIIIEDNTVTYKKIAEKLDVFESAVGEYIKILKDKGIIKKPNGTRGI